MFTIYHQMDYESSLPSDCYTCEYTAYLACDELNAIHANRTYDNWMRTHGHTEALNAALSDTRYSAFVVWELGELTATSPPNAIKHKMEAHWKRQQEKNNV